MWLETDRLRLRRWHAGELKVLQRLHGDAELMRFANDGKPWSRSACKRSFAEQDAHWDEHGFGISAVTFLDDDQPIGWIGLSIPGWLPAVMPGIEISWLIDPRHQNHGIATEGAGAWLNWGFQMLSADRILGIAQPANLASMRVMDKLGMRVVGPLTHPLFGTKVIVQTLDRDTWRAHRAALAPSA